MRISMVCLATVFLFAVPACQYVSAEDNPFADGKNPLVDLSKTIERLDTTVAQHPNDIESRDKLIVALKQAVKLLMYLVSHPELVTKGDINATADTNTNASSTSSAECDEKLKLLSVESKESGTVTGVVKNTCDRTVYNVSVAVTVYDIDDRAIEEVFDYHFSDFAPGEEWLFKAVIRDSDILAKGKSFKVTGLECLERKY